MAEWVIEVKDGKFPIGKWTELVRCKDCKWKQGSECVRFAEVRPFPDDFCSSGKRKEEVDNG